MKTIRLSFAFPNARLMGYIGAPIFFFLSFTIFIRLFNIRPWKEHLGMSIAYLLFFALFLLCMIPISSFNKVIIDQKNKTIHYCTSIYGIFNDRKPVDYTPFQYLRISTVKRRGAVGGRGFSTFGYVVYQNDIILFDESRQKKFFIKNVGNPKKAKKAAKQISAFTKIQFIEKKSST